MDSQIPGGEHDAIVRDIALRSLCCSAHGLVREQHLDVAGRVDAGKLNAR